MLAGAVKDSAAQAQPNTTSARQKALETSPAKQPSPDKKASSGDIAQVAPGQIASELPVVPAPPPPVYGMPPGRPDPALVDASSVSSHASAALQTIQSPGLSQSSHLLQSAAATSTFSSWGQGFSVPASTERLTDDTANTVDTSSTRLADGLRDTPVSASNDDARTRLPAAPAEAISAPEAFTANQSTGVPTSTATGKTAAASVLAQTVTTGGASSSATAASSSAHDGLSKQVAESASTNTPGADTADTNRGASGPHLGPHLEPHLEPHPEPHLEPMVTPSAANAHDPAASQPQAAQGSSPAAADRPDTSSQQPVSVTSELPPSVAAALLPALPQVASVAPAGQATAVQDTVDSRLRIDPSKDAGKDPSKVASKPTAAPVAQTTLLNSSPYTSTNTLVTAPTSLTAKAETTAARTSERAGFSLHDAHKSDSDSSASPATGTSESAATSAMSATLAGAPVPSTSQGGTPDANALAAAVVPVLDVRTVSSATGVSAPAGKPDSPDVPASVSSNNDAHLLPSINTAKVLQTMQGSEMRVGMHSAEFGNVSVSTSLNRQSLAAQISFDHMDLGKALTAHLPSIEARLSNEYGVHARVEVRDQTRDQNMGSGTDSSRGESGRGSGSAGTANPRGSTYAQSVESIAAGSSSADLVPGSQRLDIRA